MYKRIIIEIIITEVKKFMKENYGITGLHVKTEVEKRKDALSFESEVWDLSKTNKVFVRYKICGLIDLRGSVSFLEVYRNGEQVMGYNLDTHKIEKVQAPTEQAKESISYTLENDRCDILRKENGKWGCFRTGNKTEFLTYEGALEAKLEMEAQGLNISNIQIECL